MARIVFISHDGTEQRVDGRTGSSVMQSAVDNLVPGILGDCGGCCTCATCHGYVDPAWIDRLPPPDEEEQVMLEGPTDVRPNSRLTCQIRIRDELDGLVVRTPKSQF